MSIYCTLPRRHQYIDVNQRRNTVVSAEEARKLVDDLFNPIVAYDCDDSYDENYRNHTEKQLSFGVNAREECVYGSAFDNNNNDNYSENTRQKYLPSVLNSQSDLCFNFGNSNTINGNKFVANNNTLCNISENFNNANTANSNSRETSYSSSTKLYYAFDNFEDLRRRRKSLMPDFYGGGISGGTDSAYESSPSYESLKSVTDSNKQLKKKSKYFTLPTRRSSKSNRQKDNVHEIDKNFESKIASSLMPNKIFNENQNQVNITPKNAESHQEFHCCCRAGCHNSIIHSNRNNYVNNAGLHCCQQMLETLWEEPNSEATALVKTNRRPVSMTYSNPKQASNHKIEV